MKNLKFSETIQIMGRKSTTNKNSKKKIHLVFDPEARRKFLTGFHSRKLQRKKKAYEDAERLLKEEEKRIREEARKKYKQLVNVRDISPETEELHTEDIQLENHSVKIRELSTKNISFENNWIGVNQVQNDETEENYLERPEKLHVKKALKKQALSKVHKSLQKKGNVRTKKRHKNKSSVK